MTDTGYKCAGKPLHVSDIVLERRLDTSSEQVGFVITYWKITQHDGAFWRCSCGAESTEISLAADLDIHFSIAEAIDLQTSEFRPADSQAWEKSEKEKSWLFAKLSVLALIGYIILNVFTPFVVVSYLAAAVSAAFALIALKLHRGAENE